MHSSMRTTLAVLFLWTGPLGTGFATTEIKFLYFGAESDAAFLGARQGLDEANVQGRFLGQKYIMEIRAPGAAPGTALNGVAAVLAALDAGALRDLATSTPAVPVFNLQAADDSLRAACIPNVLHVVPSSAMARDAVAQWQKVNPGARVTASAWHGEFMKYAGRDLNKRFRASSGQAMNEYSWAGWAAVKMTSDTIARLNNANPADLLRFLRHDLNFDGQKGADMSFRSSGQLRQPMLIVENGKIVGEAPVRGVAGPDDLDTLGNNTCAQSK